MGVENVGKIVLRGSPWPNELKVSASANVHLENGIMDSIQLKTTYLSTVYVLVTLLGAGTRRKMHGHYP